MSTLLAEVQRTAFSAVESFQGRAGGRLDFSEASLVAVEEMLAEASDFTDDMSEETLSILIRRFGCYVLEVGRRSHGGEYQWHQDIDQPVLVVGDEKTNVAMAAWSIVRKRVMGDESDNIPFFYDGFTQAVKKKDAGKQVLVIG